MQQRIRIKKFETFPLALAAKEDLKRKNPDTTYQIRRIVDGFNLVRRHSVNELQRNEDHYAKKRSGLSKRQKRSRSEKEILSWVRR